MSAAGPSRILIVGLGFLGTAIASAAVCQNLETRVLAKSGTQPKGPWDLTVGDAAEAGVVLQASADVDHIVYAAGRSMPAAAEVDPLADLTQSLSPLLKVVDACGHMGCGLTLLSSGAVYGSANTLPIPEDHPTNPINVYGIRSLVAEKYTLMQADRLGFKARILRISNAFGVCASPRCSRGVVATLLHKLMHDEPFTVYGDGLAIRDYIHVADVAAAVLQLMSVHPETTVLNVGSGTGHSILDLISMSSAITGRKLRIRFERQRSFEVRRNVLDISLLRQLIELKPSGLGIALRQTWHQMTAGSLALPHQ